MSAMQSFLTEVSLILKASKPTNIIKEGKVNWLLHISHKGIIIPMLEIIRNLTLFFISERWSGFPQNRFLCVSIYENDMFAFTLKIIFISLTEALFVCCELSWPDYGEGGPVEGGAHQLHPPHVPVHAEQRGWLYQSPAVHGPKTPIVIQTVLL